MKTIAFYVTDLGFGHVTRSLALIDHILNDTEYNVYLVGSEIQVDYAKVYLIKNAQRVSFNVARTSAGTVVKENTFDIDVELTVERIKDFLATMDETVNKEVELVKDKEIVLVVSDISVIGVHVAKRLGVKVAGISNYTHYHRFKKLGIDQNLIQPFIDTYNQMDIFFELAYADDMSDITCKKEKVGMFAREINQLACSDLKSRYWPSVFISIGLVATREKIAISFQGGNVYATGDMNIEGNAHVLKLPARVGHSQDYIAASSLAIIKPGWAQVAECMIAGIPFGVIAVNPIEDGEIIEKLLAEEACFTLSADKVDKMKIKKLNMKAAATKPKKVENEAKDIANKLISLIK
jgi:hypothetical protein